MFWTVRSAWSTRSAWSAFVLLDLLDLLDPQRFIYRINKRHISAYKRKYKWALFHFALLFWNNFFIKKLLFLKYKVNIAWKVGLDQWKWRLQLATFVSNAYLTYLLPHVTLSPSRLSKSNGSNSSINYFFLFYHFAKTW